MCVLILLHLQSAGLGDTQLGGGDIIACGIHHGNRRQNMPHLAAHLLQISLAQRFPLGQLRRAQPGTAGFAGQFIDAV